MLVRLDGYGCPVVLISHSLIFDHFRQCWRIVLALLLPVHTSRRVSGFFDFLAQMLSGKFASCTMWAVFVFKAHITLNSSSVHFLYAAQSTPWILCQVVLHLSFLVDLMMSISSSWSSFTLSSPYGVLVLVPVVRCLGAWFGALVLGLVPWCLVLHLIGVTDPVLLVSSSWLELCCPRNPFIFSGRVAEGTEKILCWKFQIFLTLSRNGNKVKSICLNNLYDPAGLYVYSTY